MVLDFCVEWLFHKVVNQERFASQWRTGLRLRGCVFGVGFMSSAPCMHFTKCTKLLYCIVYSLCVRRSDLLTVANAFNGAAFLNDLLQCCFTIPECIWLWQEKAAPHCCFKIQESNTVYKWMMLYQFVWPIKKHITTVLLCAIRLGIGLASNKWIWARFDENVLID